MKKLLCIAIVLIVLDQITKHLARHLVADGFVSIIPGILGIAPFHNTYLGWLGWWAGPVYEPSPFILVVLIHLFFVVLLVAGYNYLCFVTTKNRTLLDSFFVLALAGAAGSFVDNLLFNGSWDFIYVFGVWIMDLKDIFLLTSVALIHVFGVLLLPQYLKLSAKQREKFGIIAWIYSMRKSLK